MSASSLAPGPARRRSFAPSLLSRFGLAALLLLLLSSAADAYTLVLRNGRRVTIAGEFKVTPTALTYEASPGFRVTVWLSNVDFAATDNANAEPAGSFAGRIGRAQEGGPAAAAETPKAPAAQHGPARKVVTNRDLEPSRLRREAQEEEYERTRRERGMPSKQELRRRIEEQDRALREWAGQMQAERARAELEALRSELTNVRLQLAELSFLLSQQAPADPPPYASPSHYPYFYAPPAQVITVLPFGNRVPHGRVGFGPGRHAYPWPSHRAPHTHGRVRPVTPFFRTSPPRRGR